MTCCFCDDQQCWSGWPLPLSVDEDTDSDNSYLQNADTSAPIIRVFFDEYFCETEIECTDPNWSPKVRYFADDAETVLVQSRTKFDESGRENGVFVIVARNKAGLESELVLTGLRSDTIFEATLESPVDVKTISMPFETVIFGFIFTVLTIYLARKRKKK
jgi:hypothetical protein